MNGSKVMPNRTKHSQAMSGLHRSPLWFACFQPINSSVFHFAKFGLDASSESKDYEFKDKILADESCLNPKDPEKSSFIDL